MNKEYIPLDAKRPIRVALVGTGSIAQVYHLPIISQMDEFELVGICDEEQYKLGVIANNYKVPGYIDIENLLADAKPDVVIVTTPTISHLPISLKALSAGVNLIIQHPVTLNYGEALRLEEAAKETGKMVLVAMKHRFRQDVNVLRNFLKSDELGNIWRVRAGWLKKRSNWVSRSWIDKKRISGGGVMMDLGIEMLDLIHWMLGTPKVKRIHATAHNIGLNKEVEDTATATIVYEGGLTFHLDCSWGLYSERDVAYTYFEGSRGSAQLNPLSIYKTLQGELVNVSPVKASNPTQLFKVSFQDQLSHFMRALRGEENPVSTITDAVETMRLIHYIYKSANEEREIIPE